MRRQLKRMIVSALVICVGVATFLPTFAAGPADSPQSASQEGFEHRNNILEKIRENSGGRVEVIVEEDLINTLLAVPEIKKNTGKSRSQSATTTGFRIQVFSDGRNQHSLEARAKARGSAILAKFPKYRGQVYTFSSSPNWYTRVGNFKSQHEANSAMAELKRAFPQFASEMRVVKSKIVNTSH